MPPLFHFHRALVIKVFVGVLLLATTCLIGAVAHEAGHVITAAAFGHPLQRVDVIPGIQIYPTIRWTGWSANIAWVAMGTPRVPWQEGLCLLMGSGMTSVLAYCGLFVAARLRRNLSRVILAASVLYAWDMLLYATMPLIGLRHWIVVGGSFAEPFEGARLMGLADWVFWLLWTTDFLLFHWLLARVYCRGGDSEAI